MRIISNLILIAILLIVSAQAPGQVTDEIPTQLEKPIRTTLRIEGQSAPMRGEITAWTFGYFWIMRQGGETPMRIGWDQLQGAKVYETMRRFIERDDARGYLRLGVEMLVLGEPKVAQRAFRVVERLNPELMPVTERAIAMYTGGDDPRGALVEPEEPSPEGSSDGASGDQLTSNSQPSVMEQVRALAEKMPFEVEIHESDHFIAVVDPGEISAQALAVFLERCYSMVASVLTGSPDGALFEGQWACYLIAEPEAYQILQGHLNTGKPKQSAFFSVKEHDDYMEIGVRGVTTKYLTWESVLLNNLFGAIIDRYRSEEALPAWLAVGLRVYLCREVASDRAKYKKSVRDATSYCKYNNVAVLARHNVESFDSSHRLTQAVCHLFVEFSIARDAEAFRQWINGIKDGHDWEDTMEDHFGMGLDAIAAMFEAQLGVK